MTAAKVVDWVLIEKDYRAGIKPLRQIASEYGTTHTTVNNRAKKEGWTRDLAGKIAAKAEEKVSKAALSKDRSMESPEGKATEAQVVEANAELQYRIRIEHRQDIGRARSMFQKLLHELEQITDHQDLFEEMADLYDTSGPDANGHWKVDKANELYRKIISLTGRVGNGKELVGMLEKLVKMEREAFGITSAEEQSSPLDELLKKIQAKKDAGQ